MEEPASNGRFVCHGLCEVSQQLSPFQLPARVQMWSLQWQVPKLLASILAESVGSRATLPEFSPNSIVYQQCS